MEFLIGVYVQGFPGMGAQGYVYTDMGTQGYDKGITRRFCIYGDERGIIVDAPCYSHMKCIPALVSTCRKNLPSWPQNDKTFWRKDLFSIPLSRILVTFSNPYLNEHYFFVLLVH